MPPLELGTLPYELLAGVTATVDFIADLVPGDGTRRERVLASMTAVEQHEDRLFARLMAGLRAMDRVTVHTDPRLAPYIDVDDVDRLVAGGAEASA